MDDGVGAVDAPALNHLGATESKIDSKFPPDLPTSKEAEGDDVFVDAVEDNLGDGAQPLKADSNDAVASVSSDVSGIGGVVAGQHEDEVMQEPMAVSDDFLSDENEEVPLEGNDANGISVATVNDKGGGTEDDDVQMDDKRGNANEDCAEKHQAAAESQYEQKVESKDHSIERSGASELEGHELVDEKPIQVLSAVEKLEKGDTDEIVYNGTDEPIASQNTNETNRELLSEASAGIPFGDENDTGEVSEEGYTGEREDGGSLDSKVKLPTSDLPLENVITSVDVLDKIELQNGTNGVFDEIQASLFEQIDKGDRKLYDGADGRSSLAETVMLASEVDTSLPFDGSSLLKDKECETVASNSEKQLSLVDEAQLNRGNISSSSASAEVSVRGRNGDEGEQSRQETEVTEKKPATSAVSSTLNSANPVLPPVRPAGLGRAASLLETTPRVAQQPRSNGPVSQVQSLPVEDVGNGEAEEGDETREKLQMIRVKFLRLAHRLGQTPHNVVVAQVLYRLGLAEQLRGRTGGRTGAFSYDSASAMAGQLEQTGKEPLDFSCTIMVLGKTGVGKSATINSIFDEVKFNTDAFDLGTKKVQEVEGTVQGIKVRVIDTPGLFPSWSDQRKNEKILNSVKQFIKKNPPDIVLYLDRLDMPSREFYDMPLLRSVTDIFGPSIWFNAIVVLTHAASAPPEGPNGIASTYDMFVTQRSHAVQQAIRHAAGDMRLMNPVSLVENHSACRTNRAGQRVLPNGQVWKPHLLLLSFASKILAEANTLLKLQDTPHGKPFTARSRAPPLPFLLSSLLQSRPQLKLPDEQFGEEDGFEDDLDDSSDSDEESEYDELPPFKRLTNAQLAKLTKQQRKAYHDELEYREKLFMKKQLKEEKKQRKMMKKMAKLARDMPVDNEENAEEEGSSAASVPVPMPDLALPASFDGDNPTHRYRYLDTSNQWLVRPVLDAHGWDHDVGYEGINAERLFVVKDKIPVSFSGQVSKDKKEASIQMEVASSIKHGEGKGTTLGFDLQSVGKDMAYTLRSETRFSNYKHNKATAGLSCTLLGDAITAGFKVEDKLAVNKQFRVVMSGGAMTGRGDIAYGCSLEATLRDKDYPLGRFLSSLGLSVMDWHGDLAIGGNIQSQIPIGRSSNLVARANLNNRGSGQVSIRLNSSEQIQLAMIGLIPLLKKVMGQYSTSQHY